MLKLNRLSLIFQVPSVAARAFELLMSFCGDNPLGPLRCDIFLKFWSMIPIQKYTDSGCTEVYHERAS